MFFLFSPVAMPTVGGIGKVSSEELPKIMSKSGARNHTVFSKACHVVCSTQCGNLKNFLPLRFYVKPILWINCRSS